jgi:hypothetical protein
MSGKEKQKYDAAPKLDWKRRAKPLITRPIAAVGW